MTKNLPFAAKNLRIILIETTQFCGLYKILWHFLHFSIFSNEFYKMLVKRKRENINCTRPKPSTWPTSKQEIGPAHRHSTLAPTTLHMAPWYRLM
jgi:hypothetical protein